MEQKMFCWQCQETAGNKGCTVCGVCGKTADVAALQDELVFETKLLSQVTTAMRKDGKPVDKSINHIVTVNLFITITNANFDADAIKAAIAKTREVKETLAANLANPVNPAKEQIGVLATADEDIRSLRELITYGLKGLAAYSKHANALMQDDEEVDAFIQRVLTATLDDSLSVNDLVALALETGKFGVAGMALLDKANTSAYGNPEITEVDIGVRGNPGILISGHDLRDLEMLLEQTTGTGVDVYTHSEMLPAHYYPAFKKYPHFAGNYGNAWWKQKDEFEKFNGPILMTTNCVVPPAASYKDRLWNLIDTFLDSIPDEEEPKDKKRRPTPADAAIDYVAYLLETESDSQNEDAPQLKVHDLIDTFLQQEQGRIMLDLPEEDNNDSPQEEGDEDNDEEYFTETLARIYIKQGRYQKALDIISRLSSKYPQKNAYFADQIRFLEKLIINKNKTTKNNNN